MPWAATGRGSRPGCRCSAARPEASPDLHPLLRRQVEPVTGPDGECGVELLQVPHHRVAPDLVGCVRVDRQQPQHLFVPSLGTPRTCPGHEQPLHVRQTVDSLTGAAALASESDPVGLDGDTQTTDVTDVLTDGERAVDVLGAVELAGGELVVL